MALQIWFKIKSMLKETIEAKFNLDEPLNSNDARFFSLLEFSRTFVARSRCGSSKKVAMKVNRVGKWCSPPTDVYKINTDGSARGNPGATGIGGVGRDSSGQAQFFFSIYMGEQSNNQMEAWALFKALEKACELGWRKVICEMDSMILVSLLNNQDFQNCSWRLGVIARQILNLASNFVSISFVHIPREWNKVANFLAKWASNEMEAWSVWGWGQLDQQKCQQLAQFLHEDQHE